VTAQSSFPPEPAAGAGSLEPIADINQECDHRPMADDDFEANDARATAHIAYALVYALLNELEKEAPGLRKRVWTQAQRTLEEYRVLDASNAEWVTRIIANL